MQSAEAAGSGHPARPRSQAPHDAVVPALGDVHHRLLAGGDALVAGVRRSTAARVLGRVQREAVEAQGLLVSFPFLLAAPLAERARVGAVPMSAPWADDPVLQARRLVLLLALTLTLREEHCSRAARGDLLLKLAQQIVHVPLDSDVCGLFELLRKPACLFDVRAKRELLLRVLGSQERLLKRRGRGRPQLGVPLEQGPDKVRGGVRECHAGLAVGGPALAEGRLGDALKDCLLHRW
mmetsp:Transcript_36279/g.103686  ORF Transcript_36279/g.103686 Transcript_36279/m.103686 type:complete len:237 (-) Transcript_36279:799-1509(-)